MPEWPRPRVAGIRLHPIKSLDPVAVAAARIGAGGGLELDRVWVLETADGQLMNGKRSPAVHLVRARFDADLSNVTLCVASAVRSPAPACFEFPLGSDAAAGWFSEAFGQAVGVRYVPEGAPDDEVDTGPTIVSTASLEAVCAWFPGLRLEEARERFRASIEIDGVPAFWEDSLFGGPHDPAVAFRLGEVALSGTNPCARCVVPSRNPRSGHGSAPFIRRFIAERRRALPAWSASERFDHYYRFSTNTRVAASEHGKRIAVDDALTLDGTHL